MKKTENPNLTFGEKFKRKSKLLLTLFWTMFKIGLFTFGGGYAMIHLLENEFVAKKKWLDNDEFFDLVTIAESTPGPVAINCSTYIGYKTAKFIGSIVATTAMCLPSFIIIYVISLFFNAFLANTYVAAAFKGIQVCAVFLILCAGIKMAKKIKFTPFNIVIFAATFIAMILVSIFNANFSSIFYILISGGIGLLIYSIGFFRNKLKAQNISPIEPPTIAETEQKSSLNSENTELISGSTNNSTQEICKAHSDCTTPQPEEDSTDIDAQQSTNDNSSSVSSQSVDDSDLGGAK